MFRASRSTGLFVVLVSILFLFVGCASKDAGTETSAGGESYPAGYSAPPASSKLAKVQPDMNDIEVRKIMGEPDDANAYMTGKAWIPFYYGPDTARTDWMYKGQGRVVFSRNRYSGGLKVIRVLYNPNEQ
jgi:hypothetical protein